MDGGSERRREERRRESGRTRGQKLLFEQKNNATALECSMQLHWNVQCDCIGMFNATALECSMQSHRCPRREATMQVHCSNALHRSIPYIIEKPLTSLEIINHLEIEHRNTDNKTSS